MLLTISTDQRPATDLGFLLHKHPDRFQSFELSVGTAYVGYPEADADRCTMAITVEVDPIALTRRRTAGGRTLYEYVNDRPYVASSFLSVAINKVLGSALRGRCDARPELVDAPLPLTAEVAAVACRDGEAFIRTLFEPLGYLVEVERVELGLEPVLGPDPHPAHATGDPGGVFVLRLTGRLPLRELLSHLYVLLPVLDDAKHYWVDADEIDKLLRYGGDWLAAHPRRDDITHRYLKRRPHLSREAAERLDEDAGVGGDEAEVAGDDAVEEAGDGRPPDQPASDVEGSRHHRHEPSTEPDTGGGGGGCAGGGGGVAAAADRRPRLRELRLDAAVAALDASGATSVVDLGCGEGNLLQRLLAEPRYRRIVGADISVRSLRRARERLRLERLAPHQQERVELLQTSLVYADERLRGFDAAALLEVIEHVDEWRLPSLERAVFGVARPGTVVVTTPNSEHNVRFPDLAAGAFRHDDHRFEWSRARFAEWGEQVALEHGYRVRYVPVGDDDPEVGPPTQMAVFTAIGTSDGHQGAS